MSSPESPFLAVPGDQWLCSNDLAFAISDGFPVSPGHVLVTTRRIVATWFDASAEEQAAMMELVNQARRLLDSRLSPKPDGYNVGFNSGGAAGQTVPHVHIHVIPRYHGDVEDPTGGVRHVIPSKANYLAKQPSAPFPRGSLALSTGHPNAPLWQKIAARVASAREVDLLASFAQPSGLDLIQAPVFSALREGARIRILVGDYLYITSSAALRQLVGWLALATEDSELGGLEVRLVEMSKLPGKPDSFHPKAWRILDASGGLLVVGSSNLSKAALETGIEWNLIGRTAGDEPIDSVMATAFGQLWEVATPLDEVVVTDYEKKAREAHRKFIPPEAVELPQELFPPRPWQQLALESLANIRADAYRRALVAVATGLGKTWLAAFDVLASGRTLDHCPRVLVVAHRAEILAQAETTLRTAMRSEWEGLRVSWYLGGRGDLTGDLVVASIQKLSRPEGLGVLDQHRFDYAIIDEVHHAQAPSYRRVLARLDSTFTLGLTATPERTDGLDVAALFDDVLAWQATIGDGIEEGSLVPFHYLGLKDDVDFQQIPWRSGRFDPSELERALENSERMDRLWAAWQEDPASRTLVFCCSRRHALYARDWLQRRKVAAAAVFSGDGGDPRSDSLSDFVEGKLQALCVVDLFNEGLDVPQVDRVVMLRPTESKVIFLQQLGRGLRASDHKSRLKVIDFVGNHRVFASRLIHLLSLSNRAATWADLKKFLRGDDPELPEGCLLDLEMEAKELMRSLVPNTGSAVVEAYRGMRDESGRRPTPSELLHHGYLPRSLAARYGSWFGFVAEENDLLPVENSLFETLGEWFRMLEVSSLNKSYKMVVLRVLLDHGAFWNGMEIEKLAAECRRFLLAHPTLRDDLPPTKQFPDPAAAPIKDWAAWWLEWPLSRWMDEQAGRRWFKREGDRFVTAFQCEAGLRPDFESMTAELVDYRLAHYARTRLEKPAVAAPDRLIAKVSHSGGTPILRLPTVEELPGRPIGPTHVTLPDGSDWVFKFVKVACNVASPAGEDGNQLGSLLKEWFGDDAGAPGTGYRVVFLRTERRWEVAPEGAAVARPALTVHQSPPGPGKDELPGFVAEAPTREDLARYIPVYSLEAAAGFWGADMVPEEIGWAQPPNASLKPGMFIARVRGKSMEPKIQDGSWAVFRPCPVGSREGRIVLVQFSSRGISEDGGRFTVKKYHSVKSTTPDGWKHEKIELLPLNPDYEAITVEPQDASEMMIVGDLVTVLA